MDYWELVGWTGTFIFVVSFILKDRRMLHLVGLIGAIIKLVYTMHYGLMPLIVNWILLIGIEIYVLCKMYLKPQ
jgi:hypothetical protein